jgi:acetyl-CoA acetyltransferase family protein
MEERYGVEAMGATAENLAEMYDIARDDQDRFALRSQLRAAAARDSDRLATEIIAVDIAGPKGAVSTFRHDEFIKPHTTLDGLAALRPAFRTPGGTVTAGNASGLNDGAAALLLATEAAVGSYGLTPKARIIASAVTGCEPRIMGIGPVEASRRALAKAGLSLDDVGVIELNEAFAAQSLACLRLLGLADDDPRVNPNGGAIALGHPLGMSGARITLSATLELHQRRERYALATLCVGVGQGYALVLERM